MRSIGFFIFLLFLGYCSVTRSASSKSGPNTINPKRTDVVSLSEDLLGRNYKYGGKNPNGFDCSGLVYYVFGELGIKMNASSATQANQGTSISQTKLLPGDLVFFKRANEKNIFHVSIITEIDEHNIWVIHSTSSKGVIKQNIMTSNYWRDKIYTFRNVID